MQPKQPKINQKLVLRSAIGLFVLAGLLLAFRWFKERESDPLGMARLNTLGWIAAIETVGDGKQAVVIKEDGTVVRQPKVNAEVQDRDPAWRPDGNFLFFSSNREKSKFTMFRWLPDGTTEPEMRSLGGLSQGAPFFMAADADRHGDASALITAGGKVMQYNPIKPSLKQVLPPPDPNQRTSAEPGGGSASPFEGLYERYGTSFRRALWTPDRTAVYAVMRGDLGETLVYQRLNFTNPQEAQPRAIMAGDRIDMDIDQQRGILYFTVQKFHWPESSEVKPEYIKNSKVTTPFEHVVGLYDPSQAKQPLQIFAKSGDAGMGISADTSFSEPSLSPNGAALVVVAGKYVGNGNMQPTGLYVIDLEHHAVNFNIPIAPGDVHEPTWSPDSTKIAFARRETPRSRPIYTVEFPSGVLSRRTESDRVFGFPAFSPQRSP